MWILFAFGSAFFAGLTAILAKCGIKNTDSNVATAIRTVVILAFSWVMVFVVGAQGGLANISTKTLVFLVLSGAATGASWLCYFKALQLGDINKVTPIDKSSTVITMLLALIFLQEGITGIKCAAMLLIAVGTFLMIQKKSVSTSIKAQPVQANQSQQKEKQTAAQAKYTSNPNPTHPQSNAWLFYAFASAIFASLTSILGKVGIQEIDATLGTAIRTIVVLCMAWGVVFATGTQHTVKAIDRKSWLFLALSGVATGASWLCYYTALQTGPASIVVPIDKLSIVITIAFSYLVFRETLSKKATLGLVLMVGGTLLMLV
ncbi:MAG: EamA family transporter [Faecalibacterium sp.]